MGRPNDAPRTIGDTATATLLLIQASALFRPIGYEAGVPLRYVSAASTLIFIAYLLAHSSDLNELYADRLVRSWTHLIFTIPVCLLALDVATGTVTPGRFGYWTAFYLYFATQLLAGAVLTRRRGTIFTARLLTGCILATWAGLAVNLLDVPYIQRLATYANANHANSLEIGSTRLIGFQGQANLAALTLVVLLAALVCNRHFLASRLIFQAGIVGLCVVGILLTGSRTSSLLFTIVFAVYLRNIHRTDTQHDTPNRARLVALPLLFAGVVIALFQSTSDSTSAFNTTARGRFSSLLDILFGQGAAGDQSIALRIASSQQYLDSITNMPLTGRGPDFASNQIAQGVFANVSQNAFLDWALAFGIPYSLYALVVLARTWRRARQVRGGFAASRLQVGLALVASFSIINLFGIRPLALTMSMLLGAVSITPQPLRRRPAYHR